MAVSDAVHDALRARILGGELGPGDALPSERRLSEAHGVNRHAVREALRRLEQAGLVDVTHGGATRAKDWRESGGLELLADLPLAGVAAAPHVVRDVLRMRRVIGVDVARLAARRATDAHRAALAAALPLPAGAPDLARRDAYRALWTVLLDAAGNVAYRLAYNSLLPNEDAVGESLLALERAELADDGGHAALAAAVAARDPDAAGQAAAALLDQTLEAAVDG